MTFRTKLLLLTSITVAGAVALVTGAVSIATRRSFERLDAQRRTALLQQFEREIAVQGREVVRAVNEAAQSEAVLQLSAESQRPEPDFASFYTRAQEVADATSLQFLDVVQSDLSILSSAHWAARFGYGNDWGLCPGSTDGCDGRGPVLVRVRLPEGGQVLALGAARRSGSVWVLGARRLDAAFLKSLGLAPGMRALLWLNEEETLDANGPVAGAARLRSLVYQAMRTRQRSTGAVFWSADRDDAEAFSAVPLQQGDQVMAVLLAGTSLRSQFTLERAILWIGLIVGSAGILLGVLLGWWTTERVTRPVDLLAKGAAAVAGGDWSARVDVVSRDEIGQLARAFNSMTQQLVEQRDRAIQAERVAAWRELARRLAHELKNPLFPLQITIENLQRSRALPQEEFDEVFSESTTTLLDEVKNLKTIVGRFSDFAKMPQPHFERVQMNEIASAVVRLNAAQLEQRRIACVTAFDEQLPEIDGDSDQLRRALSNLILNAMDAMPDGGTLTVRTSAEPGAVRIEVADSGAGLTAEEQSRLFTPYYTTKQHGTGLGLAIVQSVVSDHHGRISVESGEGQGARFVVVLPQQQLSGGLAGGPSSAGGVA